MVATSPEAIAAKRERDKLAARARRAARRTEGTTVAPVAPASSRRTTASTGLLTETATTPAQGSNSDLFVLDWVPTRDAGIAPTTASAYAPEGEETEARRAEFMAGAHLMGLIGRTKTLKPQQLQTVDVLDNYHRFAAVLEPRRSAKTTTLIAWALGRCASREDYLAAYTTCTTGKKARDRFLKDVAPVLERVYPDPKNRPFKIRKAAGQERIEFDNGSIFQVLAPNGDDFRSDAWDLIILDEAGEATPDMGEDLLAAALPTQDTRPEPLIVVAGTAAAYRDGNLLHDQLEAGRRGDEDTGIIAFNLPDTLVAEDTETWEQVADLLVDVHPGIGTLTTLDALRASFKIMKRELFLREYGGVFGMVGVSSGLFSEELITALELDDDKLPSPPDRFALAIAVRPNQSRASIVAAWRETDGTARGLLLANRDGVAWLAGEAGNLARKYRVPIVFDDMGPVRVETEKIGRMSPRPKLEPSTSKNTYTAAALLVKEMHERHLFHWGQEDLVNALKLVRRRKVGEKQFALGAADPDDDITPAEALSYALGYFDRMPAKRRIPNMVDV